MPPRKRAAEADASEGTSETRASKVAKTKGGAATKAAKPASKTAPKEKAKPAKKPAKPAMSAEDFEASALPLHVHFTNTPPSVSSPKKGSSEPNKHMDVGHLGSVTMLPTTFSTGSHGWKASKPIGIELTDPETGKKTKVQVQISINAVVKGSKAVAEAKADAEDEDAVASVVAAEDEDEDEE